MDNSTSQPVDNPTETYCAMEDYMVIYSSDIEKYTTVIVLLVSFLITVLSQTSVVVTIVKTEDFHIPHFAIMGCNCVVDLVIVCTSTPTFIWQFFTRCYPFVVCRIHSVLIISMAIIQCAIIAFLAFERYVFFCRPYLYRTFFTRRRVVIVIIVIFVLPLMYRILAEIFIESTYSATSILCTTLSSDISQKVIGALFFIPVNMTTAVCCYKIWRLMRETSIAPALVGVPHVKLPSMQAGKYLRMIMLVSGTLFVIYVPSTILVFTLLTEGRLKALNSREAFAEAIVLRVCALLLPCVSSFINPIIYYYTRRDLRQRLARLLGIKPAVVADLQPEVELAVVS